VFDAGISTVQVPDHLIRRNLVNLELTYTWFDHGTGMPPRLIWGTEVMRNEARTRFESIDDDGDVTLVRESKRGYGGYSYVEYFWHRRLSFGARADLFQPTDPTEARSRNFEQTYTAFLTYRMSPSARVRFEANRYDYADGQSANEFYLQWTVLWGAHSHRRTDADEEHQHSAHNH
jgi:hypothetical protein